MNLITAIIFSLSVLTASAQNSAFPNFTGDPFTKYNISAQGISASFIPYGARLTNLFVNDKNGTPQDIVLGYDTGEQYVNDTETVHTYFGAVVGRYANRIKNGTFTIDGVTSHIPENEHNGEDTLHGGFVGYDQQNWTVVSQKNDSITFSFYDQAYQGFPGDVINYATYTLTNNYGVPRWTSRLVSIPLNAPTPIMLANHVYWNLGAFVNSAALTVLNNTLYMPYADRYIQINGIEVPNGTIAMTSNTPLDFTTPTAIGANINNTVNGCGTGCTGYDNAFILDRPRYSAPEATDLTVLTLSSPETGIQLTLKTNQQSLQIYSCNNENGTIPAKQDQQHGNGTMTYEQYGCVVIETQQWIDGINNPQWGQDQYQIYGVTDEPAVNFQTYDFSILSD
jgi:aldose 1-epimerase